MLLRTHEYRIESMHTGHWGINKVFRYDDKHEILEKIIHCKEYRDMEVYI